MLIQNRDYISHPSLHLDELSSGEWDGQHLCSTEALQGFFHYRSFCFSFLYPPLLSPFLMGAEVEWEGVRVDCIPSSSAGPVVIGEEEQSIELDVKLKLLIGLD